MGKQDARRIADENKGIFEAGFYKDPAGRKVHVGWAETHLYRPGDFDKLWEWEDRQSYGGSPTITVVEGTSGDMGRLVAEEFSERVAVLNFASARNAGGGYTRGTKAQEEDLCRCSALYPSLLDQPEYYKANRGQNSVLYTDHLIYTKGVTFFRSDKGYRLLPSADAVNLDVITAPAPNTGEAINRGIQDSDIRECLDRRCRMVLSAARHQGVRNLVLGAWGCGVFRNDPEAVADAFGAWLESPTFAGVFDHVVFAIYANSLPGQVNLEVFKKRFRS